jgi:hypothetical protein
MIEHRRHFPRCPYICNLPVGNIPIGEEESDEASSEEMDPLQLGIDICGPFEPDTLRLTLLQDAGRVGGAQPLTGSLDDVAANLAITTCRGPTHLHMVTPYSRLKSFAGWPASTGQAPETMARAGDFTTWDLRITSSASTVAADFVIGKHEMIRGWSMPGGSPSVRL